MPVIVANINFAPDGETDYLLVGSHDPTCPYVENKIDQTIKGYGTGYEVVIRLKDYHPNFIGGKLTDDWENCAAFVYDPALVRMVYPEEDNQKCFCLKDTYGSSDFVMLISVVAPTSGSSKFMVKTNSEVRMMRFGRNWSCVSGHMIVRLLGQDFVEITLGDVKKRVYINGIKNML